MAADYLLTIDGIEGESSDSKHKGAIQVESYSLVEVQRGTFGKNGGGGAGKVQMGDVHFVMMANKASPKLFLACASGQHIPKAVLTCRKAGKLQQEFYKWTFSDVLVSSFQTNGSSAAPTIPVEQFSLAFAKVEVEYREQKADGSLGGAVAAGWNQKTCAPV